MITWEYGKIGTFEISNLKAGDTFELDDDIGMAINIGGEIHYIMLDNGEEWYIDESTQVKLINLKIIVG